MNTFIKKAHDFFKDPLNLLVSVQVLLLSIGVPFLDFNIRVIDIFSAVAGALIAEYIFTRFFFDKKPSFKSALAASLSISIFFRATSPTFFVLVSFLAIASKFLLSHKGKHVFNPSNFGMVILVFLFPFATTLEFTQWGSNPYMYVFIAAAALFVVYKASALYTTISFLLSYTLLLILSVSYAPDVFTVHHYGLLGPSLIIFAAFMLTDPKSAPTKKEGRIIHGVSVALMYFFLEALGIRYAIFLAAFLIPIMNNIFVYLFFILRVDSSKLLANFATLIVSAVLLVSGYTSVLSSSIQVQPTSISKEFILFGVEARQTRQCKDPVLDLIKNSEIGLVDIGVTLGVSWGDYNNDGLDDLFISNTASVLKIKENSLLYKNNGDGTFTDVTKDSKLSNIKASSAIFADYDNDGDLDLFISQTKNKKSNILAFRNSGDETFTNITEDIGLSDTSGVGRGALSFADYDNDGDLDFLFISTGNIFSTGGSADVAFEKNISDPSYVNRSRISCDADIVTELRNTSPHKEKLKGKDFNPEDFACVKFAPSISLSSSKKELSTKKATAEGVFDAIFLTPGVAYLYENKNGFFEKRIDFKKEIEGIPGMDAKGWVYARRYEISNFSSGRFHQAISFDFDKDLLPDIFFSIDFGANALLKNNGNFQFEDVTEDAGVNYTGSGMGSSISDYDNDGDIDIIVDNTSQDYLFENNGDETFTNRLDYKINMIGTAWGVSFTDYDLDGFEDIFVANGDTLRTQISTAFKLNRNLFREDKLYKNNKGENFYDVTNIAICPSIGSGRALAVSDYDNDGDEDFFVGNIGEYKDDNDGQLISFTDAGGAINHLYKNSIENKNYLKIKLEGTISNRMGIGARVEVASEEYTQTKVTTLGDSYHSQSSHNLLFGFAGDKEPVDVHVYWPSGLETVLKEVEINQHIEIIEGSEEVIYKP